MSREPEESGVGTADFEEEALPHLDAVYRFALRLSGSEAAAEDLVQDTFLRAYRAWDQYTPGTQCKSWLFTICRNVFLRRHERGQLWSATAGIDPEGSFFESIVDDEVLRAIDALPEEYRTAVVLSDLEGLPYDEIAELMEVPVGTVKSRLFRGRRRLQQVLYEYAVEMGYIPARNDTDE